MGVTPVALTIFRPRVPSPAPVLAVTVQVALAPVPEVSLTLVIAAPVMPLGTRAKWLADRPVTAALKVTVHVTLAALVGLGSARVMDSAVGDRRTYAA